MLLHVNSELYDDISKRVKETNGEELGQCFVLLVRLLLHHRPPPVHRPSFNSDAIPLRSFVAQADYLKMYSQYCSNQAAAREAVMNASKTNPRFRAFQEVRGAIRWTRLARAPG
jgi:hypothetical protein